ncbi:hypothetical protein PANT_7c00305 [Moesziomyces antarcticus T-34]|uniref:Protein SQS1 n=1 Tax=Pseudozyma antarctica (strain T-34) TaxID=1151754 RepID=M9MBR2_PSEA3|nr:hypothetical protein PANT_7c00305 [Moesziomyces antarcticus T-34]
MGKKGHGGGGGGGGGRGGFNRGRGGSRGRGGFRGRGRGGNLAATGQNRVGFDYSALTRGRRAADGDDDDDDDDDSDEDDFAIEPPAGYRHKVKPHLESDALSDQEKPPAKNALHSGPSTPLRPHDNFAGPASKPRFTPRFNAPTNFPEFYTSRGAHGGAKFRPPEETEDAKYLAGIPGLRRPDRKQRDRPRFGDPADKAQSNFRVPVAFVKATGEFGDPLKGNLPPRDPNEALLDPNTMQQQQPAINSGERHAGLGFSNRSQKPPGAEAPKAPAPAPASTSQSSAAPYAPTRAAVPAFPPTTFDAFDFDSLAANNAQDHDEVDALLAAFPGSKELAPGESMLEDDPTASWTLPAFQPHDATAQRVSPSAAQLPSRTAISSSSSDDEEIILVPNSAQPSFDTAPTLDVIVEAKAVEAVESTVAVEAVEQLAMQEDLGFVIDLEGEDPASLAFNSEHISATSSSSFRVALGDRAAADGAKTSRSRKKAVNRHGKPHRVPRESDSDLDWGSDGPPGASDNDTAYEEGLAAAAAGISITRTNDTNGITDPILAKAIRADRHEWESDDDDDAQLSKQSKRRGGQRAKRSQAGRATASRSAARSRKADQDAIVADYMQNLLDQAQGDSDSEQDVFATDDMVVETVDGELPDGAAGKGKSKAKARRLSNKLDEKTNLDAMIRFMNGMDPQKGGRQLGFGDIEDEIHMDEVKEWLTESEDDSDADRDQQVQDTESVATIEAESKQDRATASHNDDEDEDLAEQLRQILEDDNDESSEIFSESSSESSDDDDDDDDDDSDSDDDDEGMFRGKQSWADEDEDFIRALSSQVGGAGIGSRGGAAPSSKRAQKKLFHAISNGDFSDLADLAAAENEIDSDDPAYGLGSIPTARNGKRKGRKFTDDDLWAEQLQQQWDKDRASKASKKQQRLAERQAAALNPFPNTHGKAGSGKTKSTKKMAKLARKAEKREMRASLKAHSNNVVAAIQAAGSVDAVDASLFTFGGKSSEVSSLELEERFAFNMDELNQQIQLFLQQRGRNTMRCQPMDKFARAEVHALANAYNLQSKSKGKGRDRFPTLIKTSRSGLNVDWKKVKRIVRSNAGATFGNDAGKSDFRDKNKRKGKGAGGGGAGMYGVGGGTVPKNREGEEVGFGADKIGADNIGHKLLAAMGWTEGMGIGSSQGMANPVSATVKTSRGGLGF